MNITQAIKIAQSISADVEILTFEQQQATLIVNDQRNKNSAARQLLKETDWYITRNQETGTTVPENITIQRQAARNSVVDC